MDYMDEFFGHEKNEKCVLKTMFVWSARKRRRGLDAFGLGLEKKSNNHVKVWVG